MRCEICGRKIQGTPKHIIVEGAKLVVCKICAKFGSETPVATTQSKISTKRTLKIPKKPVQRRVKYISKPIMFEEDYELVENFGEKVKKAREKLGWKQEDLAREIKEKESIISKIETMEITPPLNTIKKLEKVLNIKLTVPASKISETPPLSTKEPSLTLGDAIILKKKKK